MKGKIKETLDIDSKIYVNYREFLNMMLELYKNIKYKIQDIQIKLFSSREFKTTKEQQLQTKNILNHICNIKLGVETKGTSCETEFIPRKEKNKYQKIKRNIKDKIQDIQIKLFSSREFKTTKEQQFQNKNTLTYVCDMKVEILSREEIQEILSMLQILSEKVEFMTLNQVEKYIDKMKEYEIRASRILLTFKEDKIILTNRIHVFIQKLESHKHKLMIDIEKARKEQFYQMYGEKVETMKVEEAKEILSILRTLIIIVPIMTINQLENTMMNIQKYQNRLQFVFLESDIDKEKILKNMKLLMDRLYERRSELQKEERILLTCQKVKEESRYSFRKIAKSTAI